jgi:hypothetical protein
MDEKLYTTLKNLGIDPSLVVPSNPITEVVDSTALNELIIKKLGVEKGEKVLEELRKAEVVHSLLKAKRKGTKDAGHLIPIKVWVKDPTKNGGGYYATRYISPEEAQELISKRPAEPIEKEWLDAGFEEEEAKEMYQEQQKRYYAGPKEE